MEGRKKRGRSPSTSYQRLTKYRAVNKEGSSASSDLDSDSDLENYDLTDQTTEPINKRSESPESTEERLPQNSPDLSFGEHGSNYHEDYEESSDSYSDSDSYYSNNSASSSSSEFSDDDEDVFLVGNPITNLKENLKRWAIKNNITLKALSELLLLLFSWLQRFSILLEVLHILPKDARTLLGTKKKVNNVRPMECHNDKRGEFVYFGVSTNLRQRVKQKYFPEPLIPLIFNIDGLPLFKSSANTFWPILCSIYSDIYEWKVFPVAIFFGPGKPKDVDDYFKEFVEEMTSLINNGITIDDRHYNVCIKCYICDTPARSFVKCIPGHGGFYCCERCEIKGETLNKKRIYPESECAQRTENSFLSKLQAGHHTGTCPLIRIPGFLPITMFVLDYMHLLCLGVTKRLLVFYWVGLKKKVCGVSLRASQIRILSNLLESLRQFSPIEFPRKPRGLTDVSRFKATEFRFFLLYSGPIVLKKVIPKDLYKHFLLLHTASRILCSSTLCLSVDTVRYAKKLLHHFFNLLPKYYGHDSQIINMHNLLHVADDVLNFKCALDRISGFPFENELYSIKKKIRSSNAPLAQYCNRLAESEYLDYSPKPLLVFKPLLKRSQSGAVTKVRYLNMVLSAKRPDNFVLLKNKVVGEIISTYVNEDKQVVFCGQRWSCKEDIFKFPCGSSRLQEWIIKDKSETAEYWTCNDIQAKLFHCAIDETDYAMAILHTNV